MERLSSCNLCPRGCGVNRIEQSGVCGERETLRLSRAALHFWEEPCISGEKGSGTVFFSGCQMGCVFCQNHEIAQGTIGMEITIERLGEIFLELQEKGANNVNLVTPDHFIPQIVQALKLSKRNGLILPIVYNTGSYVTVDALKQLDGLVDIYLPDFKFWSEASAMRYAKAKNYCQVAKDAIDEMVRQVGTPIFEKCASETEPMIKKGVIVRHLCLPGGMEESKAIIRYLYETYGDTVFVSIMNQYTPMKEFIDYPELNQTITEEQYETIIDYAIELGIENGFIQEGDTAKESFIPQFDYEGVLHGNL